MSAMPCTSCTELQLVEPRFQFDGLHLLFAAAETLEKRTANVSPSADLNTQREKRKLEVYVRRFEDMERPNKRKETLGDSKQTGSLVGRTISKHFKDERGRRRAYKGTVLSEACATGDCLYDFGAGVTATVKYFVQYVDGDTEDMTHTELLKHLID